MPAKTRAPAQPQKAAKASDKLTPKQLAFAQQYLIDLNATQAAIRSGYSAQTAEQQGSRLLTNVKVLAAITAAQKKRSERTEITADMVLNEFWAIATADPNDLIEYRRTCCRHCWGANFRRQYTDEEMRVRRERPTLPRKSKSSAKRSPLKAKAWPRR